MAATIQSGRTMTRTRLEIERLAADFGTARAGLMPVLEGVWRAVVTALEARGLKYIVTMRLKAQDSLVQKLWQHRNRVKVWPLDPALDRHLYDLLGIRVLVYRDADVVAVEKVLDQTLVVSLRPDLVPRRQAGYRARHLIVRTGHGQDAETGTTAFGSRCEIQICTIADHIFHEWEHDIRYKQPAGKPDDGQIEQLETLRAELDLCAQTLGRLERRVASRLLANDQPMTTPAELTHYLAANLGRPIVGPVEDLLAMLLALYDRLTPQFLNELFAAGVALAATEKPTTSAARKPTTSPACRPDSQLTKSA